MIKLVSKFLLVFLCLTTLSAYAMQADENHTLHIILTNTTKDTLRFDRVISCKPGNRFTVTPQEVRPGEAMDVMAEILLNEDIQKLQQEKLQLVSQLEESQSRIQQLEDQNKVC